MEQIDVKALRYNDITIHEDKQLQLLANLLIQAKEGLTVEDTRELGVYIHRYLQKKSIIDHYFWNRKLKVTGMTEAEIQSEIQKLSSEEMS